MERRRKPIFRWNRERRRNRGFGDARRWCRWGIPGPGCRLAAFVEFMAQTG